MLLEQHLAWLDREIAAEAGAANPETPPGASSEPTPAAATPSLQHVSTQSAAASGSTTDAPPPPAFHGNAASAETLLDEYRVAPETLRQDVRKGCLIYFALAFAALFIAIGMLWIALRD